MPAPFPRHFLVLTVVAVLFGAFAWWGLHSGSSGREAAPRREAPSAEPAAPLAALAPVGDAAERDLAWSAEEAPVAEGAPVAHGRADGGAIRGIVRTTLGADLTGVRVAAVPRGGALVGQATVAECLAEPSEHGWFVADCDPSGAFVIGPGLDPGLEYALVAAGEGEANAWPFRERHRAGSTVELATTPVVGLTIQVEDSAGERFDWSDHNDRPIGLTRPGPAPAIGDEREPLPGSLVREMLGLPEFFHATDQATFCRFDDPTDPAGRRFVVWIHDASRGAAAPLRFEVTLEPVVHGLREKVLVVEGLAQQHEPTTIHFPPDIADALRSCAWPVLVEFEPTGGAYSVTLAPGTDSWTTHRVAPGDYRVSVQAWRNKWFHPEVYGAEGVRLGESPVDLTLPRTLRAAFVTVPWPAGEHSILQLDAPVPAFPPRHVLMAPRRGELVAPLLWDSAKAPEPEVSLTLRRPDASVPLLCPDGERAFTPEPGERIELTEGAATEPPPRWRPR